MNITIGFSTAKSPWAIGSKIIESVEKRDYSHVYIRAFDLQTGLDMVYQASHGCVNSCTYDNFNLDHIPVKEYSLTCSATQYIDMITFLKKNLGIPYSRSQIVLIGIKKLLRIELNIRNNSNAEICSELGARVCRIYGIDVGNDLDFTTPSDLDSILIKNNIPRTL